MARNYVQCELCKKIIDTCGIRQHLQWHQNELKRQEEKALKHHERASRRKFTAKLPKCFHFPLICKFCNRDRTGEGKVFSSITSLIAHESQCRYNSSSSKYDVNKISNLELELNDDGKLFNK